MTIENVKVTKDLFKKEAKKYFDERLLLIKRGYTMYGSEIIPSLFDLFKNSNQSSHDMTKILNYIIYNYIYGFMKQYKNVDIKNEKNSMDMSYHDFDLEAKCAIALNHIVKGWTGNKTSNKTPIHLLIGYTPTPTTISALFLGIINLDKCIYTQWKSSDSDKSSFSKLQIHREDVNNIHILLGGIKPMKNDNYEYCQFLTESL